MIGDLGEKGIELLRLDSEDDECGGGNGRGVVRSRRESFGGEVGELRGLPPRHRHLLRREATRSHPSTSKRGSEVASSEDGDTVSIHETSGQK